MSASAETVTSVREDDKAVISSPPSSSSSSSSIIKFVVQSVKQAPTWENKFISGAVLASWNILFLFLCIANLSFSTVVLYSAAAVILGGFAFGTITGQRGKGSKTLEPISKAAVDKFAEQFHSLSIVIATRTREILMWQSPIESGSYAAGFGVAGFIASFISIPVAVYLYGNYHLSAKYINIMYQQYVAPVTAPYVKKAQQTAKVYLEKIPVLSQLTANMPSKKIL